MVIIGAIIIGILILALIILCNTYLKENTTNDFDIGVIMGGIIAILMGFEVSLVSDIIGKPKPSALDVYRGNTELEIRSINGIPIDTVIIWKSKEVKTIRENYGKKNR